MLCLGDRNDMRRSMASDWRSQEPGTQGRGSTLKCAVDNWMVRMKTDYGELVQ